jgi:hypothetical protein
VKKLGLLISLIAGCAMLIAAFGIGYANWGEFANQVVVMQILMGVLLIEVLFLALLAILSKGKDRWRALTLDGALFLGLSGLVFFSVGWMVTPFALFLFVFSLWKLLHDKTEIVTI